MTRRGRSLQSVTEGILAHLNLPELLRELLSRLRAVLAVDTATILLRSERGDSLSVRASKGLEEEVEHDVEIPMGRGISGTVAVRRQAVIVDDVNRVDPVSPFLRRLSSMMVAPLVVAEQVLGVLHVGMLQPRTFGDADLYLMQVVADRVALAIKNVHTYDAQQRESQSLAHAREEVREIGERFRLLFERSPLPMWVFDLATLRILDVNEAGVHHYGWSRDELLGMTIADIRPPDEVPQLRQALTDGSEGLIQRGLFRHRRKDGSMIDVEVTTRGIEFDGREARIALIVDITRDRQAQSERTQLLAEIDRQRVFLQTITDNATSALIMMDGRGRGTFWNPAAERITGYTAEAERASRVKSEFLSAMSHELRTPLNAIAGYVDLIEAGVYGPATPEQLNALERVRRNQAQLLTLINDVLHFTKLEAGRLEFDLHDTALDGVMEGLRSAVESQARARGVRLSLHPCDPSMRVVADPDRVRQILLNLIGNAIKFTAPGGWVRVECLAQPDRVLIEVRDNGRGFRKSGSNPSSTRSSSWSGTATRPATRESGWGSPSAGTWRAAWGVT